MLENIRGDSWGSIPPLRMPSLLPHDLCHGWSSCSRHLPLFYFLKQPDAAQSRASKCSAGESWQYKEEWLWEAQLELKILDRMFFPEVKLEKVWKKSLAAPVAVKSSRECSKVCIWLWSFPKSRPISELFQTPEIWFLIFSHSRCLAYPPVISVACQSHLHL